MSQIVIHGGTVYLSGQVADIATLESSDITAQTEQVLAKVDALLEQAGTSKAKLLSAQIWVKDMEEHFAPMNKVWCDWVDPDNKPVRACVASPMARPSILVEVMAVAAL
jgi:enamine deaminase RidA (YjgF/YER057c/UK114 family)